jgi:predicted PurR-regulated permease PerM
MPDDPRFTTRSGAGVFATRVLIALGLLALAVVLWQISHVLVLLFAGIVIATMLRALSRPLSEHTPLSAGWALAVVIVLIVAFLALFFWFLGSQLTQEFGEISQRLPEAWSRAREWLSQNQFGRMLMDSLESAASSSGSGGRLATFAGSAFGFVADAFLILIMALFLAASPQLYRDGTLRLVPPASRRRAGEALDAVGEALRKWLMGQGIAMLAIGILTGLGLWILGVPMALALGVLAGLLEFVPFIGPLAAAIPGVLLAFTVSPSTALYAALLYLAVQQLEGNLILPLIQKWAVSLPPLLTILAVAIFGLLFGFIGIIVATPLMIAIMVLTQKLYVHDALERPA